MDIKDICVSEDRLEEVRGGQYISAASLGLQVGGNTASSSASSYGIGNKTTALTEQVAPQVFSQSTDIHAVEVDRDVLALSNSIVGGFGRPMKVR